MRIGRRLVKALTWGLVLCLSILGGGLWFAYWYMTDGETCCATDQGARGPVFPGLDSRPGTGAYQSVRRQGVVPPAQDDSEDRRCSVRGAADSLVEHQDRLANKLAKGQLEAREVVVSQPTLRLRRPTRRHLEP